MYVENDDKNFIYTKNYYQSLTYLGNQILNGVPVKEYILFNRHKKTDLTYRKWGTQINANTIFSETQCVFCANGHWYVKVNPDGSVEQHATHDHKPHK